LGRIASSTSSGQAITSVIAHPTGDATFDGRSDQPVRVAVPRTGVAGGGATCASTCGVARNGVEVVVVVTTGPSTVNGGRTAAEP
jgi:hypothetical protein